MAFDPVYVRERDFYSVGDLARLLGLDLRDALACVRAWASRGVLTLRSDAAPEGEGADEELAALGKYQFTWVGLARWRRALVCAYPKYYPRPSAEFPHPPEGELAQLFRVLRKSSGRLAGIGAALPDADEGGGPLSLMLALLGSYEENGVYTNYVRVIRDNGSGEIAWGRTIVQNQPFMDGNTPVYFDLKTRDTSRDAADLVTRLHRCVLTRCSADLRRWGIDELLGLAEVDLSGEDLEDLGEPEALTRRLELERSVQFVTWKQDVIDMLLRYLNPSEEYESPDEEFCLGTASFYHAWELACKAAFSDRLSDRIDSLGFPLAGGVAGPRRRDAAGHHPEAGVGGRRRRGVRRGAHAHPRRHRDPRRRRGRSGLLHLRREVLRAEPGAGHCQGRSRRGVRDQAGALPERLRGLHPGQRVLLRGECLPGADPRGRGEAHGQGALPRRLREA